MWHHELHIQFQIKCRSESVPEQIINKCAQGYKTILFEGLKHRQERGCQNAELPTLKTNHKIWSYLNLSYISQISRRRRAKHLPCLSCVFWKKQNLKPSEAIATMLQFELGSAKIVCSQNSRIQQQKKDHFKGHFLFSEFVIYVFR